MEDLIGDILKDVPQKRDLPVDASKTKSSSSSSKAESSKGSTSKKDDAKSKKKDVSTSDNSEQFNALSDIMQKGFSSLQELFRGCIEDYSDVNEFENFADDNGEIVAENSNSESADFFQTLTSEVEADKDLGDDVSSSLAALADKLLVTKLDSSKHKEKCESYKRPKNVEFLATPQVNTPVWASLSVSAKSNDLGLQQVQQNLLLSAVPVLRVMEKLNSAKDDLNTLDVRELLRTLRDNLTFIGSANVGIVRKRRALLKNELPLNMQLLCQDSVSFSGSNLFGNSLSTDIKEISELNKLYVQFRGRGRGRGFPMRGRGRGAFRGVRGNGSQFKRGFRGGRYIKRFNSNTTPKKQPLNQERPSSN